LRRERDGEDVGRIDAGAQQVDIAIDETRVLPVPADASSATL
jgi:hypothetical protein